MLARGRQEWWIDISQPFSAVPSLFTFSPSPDTVYLFFTHQGYHVAPHSKRGACVFGVSGCSIVAYLRIPRAVDSSDVWLVRLPVFFSIGGYSDSLRSLRICLASCFIFGVLVAVEIVRFRRFLKFVDCSIHLCDFPPLRNRGDAASSSWVDFCACS